MNKRKYFSERYEALEDLKKRLKKKQEITAGFSLNNL